MKLLIVTSVKEFHDKALRLLKKAKIESFSGSEIEGYKNAEALLMTNDWFSSKAAGIESSVFFSFTEDDKIELMFDLIKEFNKTIETNNPIRAVVVPIEKYI
ncbi:hypothetical protein AB9K26_14570 [Psychroserpens sp. XS_ASV72]|uniref:hypothetical protein n=1 Tax=Psychroserpens sp. XS_ASV72 TaxID=3241293 RepID=UPI0035153707